MTPYFHERTIDVKAPSALIKSVGFTGTALGRSLTGFFRVPDIDAVLRTIRATIGGLLLMIVITTILIPQIVPVSGDSYVNAKLEWIRTPIKGDLFLGEYRVGDSVNTGTVLGGITNERADDYFLNQLKSEQSALNSNLLVLQNQRQHWTTRRVELKVRVDESLSDLEEKHRMRLSIVRNEMTSARRELSAVEERLKRYERANRKFRGDQKYAVVSRATMEELHNKKSGLETSIESQKTTIDLIESKLESALTGTFISESTPLEQQQLLEVEQSLIKVEAEIQAMTLKLDALTQRVAERSEHLDRNTHYQMVAGASGTIWDIGFPDGSYVSPGDSVVAITDTSTLSVEGNFHQRYLDNIEVGYAATVDLMGSSARLSGVVSAVKIRDQIKSHDLSAFNFDSPATNEFKVIIALDNPDDQQLYIGQRARVIVSKSKSRWLSSVLLFFN